MLGPFLLGAAGGKIRLFILRNQLLALGDLGIHPLLDLRVHLLRQLSAGNAGLLHLQGTVLRFVGEAADRQYLEQSSQYRYVRRGGRHRGRHVQHPHQYRKARSDRTDGPFPVPLPLRFTVCRLALPDAGLDPLFQLCRNGDLLIVLSCLFKLVHHHSSLSSVTRSFFKPVYSLVFTVLSGTPVTALISLRESSS